MYLIDEGFKKQLKELLTLEEGPFLQVGSGGGFLSEVIPDPKVLVDPNVDASFVMKKRIQQVFELELNPKVLVSNLPFDQSIQILIHCRKYFPNILRYYVIIQKQVAHKMIHTRTPLGFKMRHLFKIRKIRDLSRGSFRPRPAVSASFLVLQRKDFDQEYLFFLSKITQVRKKLKHNFEDARQPEFDKRITEYSDSQLYEVFLNYRKLS